LLYYKLWRVLGLGMISKQSTQNFVDCGKVIV
jgi:hypothetical protein